MILTGIRLGYLWHDDCCLCWDLWPAHMTDALRAEGRIVWDRSVGPTPDQSYLPEGVVAILEPSNLYCRTSSDGGKTWNRHQIVDLNGYGHFQCIFLLGDPLKSSF